MKNRELPILAAKLIALGAALVAIQGISSLLLPAAASAAEPEEASRVLPILLGVSLLHAAALAYPTLRSRWGGWRLVLALFVVFYGTHTVMGQIESLVYLGDRLPPGMLGGLFAMGALTAALFSPLLVVVLGKTRTTSGERQDVVGRMAPTAWLWKLALLSAVYLILYYGFGYYVAWQSPAVRDYYGGTDPGTLLAQLASIWNSTPWMFLLQAARGALLVGLALPVIRMMRGAWWEAGLALSLLFTAPVLYLLLPNPLMPELVRLTHLVETAPYQFLYGWLVAALLHSGPRAARQTSRSAAGAS